VLWAATLFTGTVALSRVLDRERENESIRALLLSPAPRAAIYLGKLIAVSLLMIAVELVLVVIVGGLFSTGVFAHPGWLALVLVLGTLGFASTGVVFSAALLRSRSRDALLGALLFPIVIPVLLAASRATACMFDPLSPDLEPVAFWVRFLAATDVIYISLGLWVFEPVVSGE
jgi:heme exporter protein B